MRKIEIIQTLVVVMIAIILIYAVQKSSQQTIVGLAKTTEALLETIMPDEVTAKIVNGFGDTSFLNIPKEQYKIGKRL